MLKEYDQITLWSEIGSYYKIKEPVILLEMFAGIGAQRRGLEIAKISIDNEKSKICEWAYNSYCGYNAIHIKDKTDYAKDLDKEALIKKVIGTSVDYNSPLDIKALERKPLVWLKNAYNNIIATHNLVNIMEVKGRDLGELPQNQTSILCYSFPCQDLSLAGHRKGIGDISQKEGGTRSGLLWEIERILLEREREIGVTHDTFNGKCPTSAWRKR